MEQTIVIDYGSHSIRAGPVAEFPTNDDRPSVVIPSLTSTTTVQGATTCHPIRHGQIQNWPHFETLLHHVLVNRLGATYQALALIAEPLFTSKSDREQMVQLMFEAFDTQGVFIADQPTLTCYAMGRTTGTVVDIGEEKVDVSAVIEGLVQQSTKIQLPTAGRELTQRTRDALTAHGNHEIGLFQAEKIKEQVCCVLDQSKNDPNFQQQQQQQQQQQKSKQATLPDGQVIEVPHDVCEVGEALFENQNAGIHQAAYECICNRHDIQFRKQLVENLIVCGGGSGIKRIMSRFGRELRTLFSQSYSPSVLNTPEYMPEGTLRFPSWTGAAVLAKIISNQNQWVTKQEYFDSGPAVIHRKCS
eukprot:TRINITY_DN3780_c0_g3_i1.p1 TRINITY_DN3780_c0_g3~~TRINITY_DN3780_c0_g3_i1.p1  ORF type:complete len:380 (-),score=32.54 TRINITY_DN3780_c0_g3_i1:121-1197(-)